MKEVVIIDGVRTPFGKMGGALRQFSSTELAGFAIKGLVEKTEIMKKGNVDCVFAGSAMHDSKSLNPTRYAVQLAGLPFDVSASYVEMQCGSAIDAINHAAWKIMSGSADVVIAGGMESYSQATVKFSMANPPYKLIPPLPLQLTLSPFPEHAIDMITVSEKMAKKWGIKREDCDKFAYNSQIRAAKAVGDGTIGSEIIPITIPATRKTPEIVFDKDEQLRPDSTLDAMSKLKPVLGEDCVTTAGNASGRNDGAAFILMMSAEKANELGYEPKARFVVGADVGVEPKYMGIGAAYASIKAITLAGLKVSDIDVFECNEAFAAQNLAVIKEIESITGETIDMSKWNPNGGAIAFGHPNGASGARIAMFAMAQLKKTGGRYGLFTSCCGGGLGVATIIENLER